MASSGTRSSVVEHLALARRRTAALRALASEAAGDQLRALDLEVLASVHLYPDDRRTTHADRLAVSRGAVSQCLDRLRDAGMVSFERSGSEQAGPVSVSTAGARLADRALVALAIN